MQNEPQTKPENEPQIKAAENHWDTLRDWRSRMPPRSRWNESHQIVRDQNFRICGKYLDGENAGLVHFFKDVSGLQSPLNKGVSVGCGTGIKEMRLIQAGIVDHFDLCDLSSVSLAQGQQVAVEWGLQDKVTFRHGNAFENIKGEIYDLVYWDNALHHMQSADASVDWSYSVLNPNGWFLMTEFVGANRFQWPNDVLEAVNSIRNLLPDNCFYNPRDPDNYWPRKFRAPTLQEMEYDPSESIDSEGIIVALGKYFPGAAVKHVGGTIYHLALNDILTNIPEESDLLSACLLFDKTTEHLHHYAVAAARKVEL